MKGKERKGKERKGKERKGKERKGKERKGKERKGKRKEKKRKEKKRKKRKKKTYTQCEFTILVSIKHIENSTGKIFPPFCRGLFYIKKSVGGLSEIDIAPRSVVKYQI
jgi:hypothetical protein